VKEVLAWTLRFTEAMLPTMSNPVKLRIKALRAIVHEVLDGSAGLLLKPMQNFTFLVQGPWPVSALDSLVAFQIWPVRTRHRRP
jgi:hypothetical protein